MLVTRKVGGMSVGFSVVSCRGVQTTVKPAPEGRDVESFHYKRVLLKLSGEALIGDVGYGIDPKVLESIAQQLEPIVHGGAQVAIVVGGGNIFRGLAASAKGMDRAQGDYIGMLATVMNSLALQEALEREGVFTRVMSAIEMQAVAEPYIRRRAIRHIEKGRVVIFAAGTGNPYFTTDTTAALRALEIGAELIMKATKVDGVYSADPVTDPSATRIEHLSYREVIERRLEIIDVSAVDMCRRNQIPIIVFNLFTPGNMCRVCQGERIGTRIDGE